MNSFKLTAWIGHPTRLVIAIAFGAFLLSGWAANDAHAQRPSAFNRARLQPYQRPVTSPYLDLLGGGSRGFAFRYFRNVQPELEFRRTNAFQTRSLQSLERRVDDQDLRIEESLNQLGETGHATRFMDTGGYFPNLRR